MKHYEETIIGGIAKGIILPSEIPLTASDFTDEVLSQTLTVSRRLEAENKPIDADSIYSLFSTFENFGWLSRSDLDTFAKKANSLLTVNFAVEKLSENALKKELTENLSAILENTNLSGGQLLDLLSESVRKGESDFKTMSSNFEFIADLVEEQTALYQSLHEGKTIAIPTGFANWDENLLDGFSKGDEHIIVGLTGSGKSALALNCVKNQARKNFTVGVVSREMAKTENLIRLQASSGRIPRGHIRKNLSVAVLSALKENLQELKDLRIAFDTKTADIETLRMQTKLMCENHGLDILYVDYLQLMRSNSKEASRANEVQKISRILKETAMENNIPVVSLCQFSRGAIKAEITEVMHYLKESSGIEQDASTITLVQTEKDTSGTNALDKGSTTIIKNRNGATYKTVPMVYDGAIFTFSEVTNASYY